MKYAIKKKRNTLRWAVIGIVASFLILPWTLFFGRIELVSLCICLYVLWMGITRKAGYSMVILSMALCQPGGIDSTQVALVSGKMFWLFTACRIDIVMLFLWYWSRSEIKIKSKWVIPCFIVLSFIECCYDACFNTKAIFSLLNFLIYAHLGFALCYHDAKTCKGTFYLYSLCYIFILLYAFLEYFYGIGPYMLLYDASESFEEIARGIPRARGLCGHPLVFSGIVIVYNAILYSQRIIEKKTPTWFFYTMLFLCLFGTIISASRTSAIIFFVLLLLFAKMSGMLRLKHIFIFVAFLSVFAILSVNYFGDLIVNVLERFNDNAYHREAAFPSVLALVTDNPLGVGANNVLDRVGDYATKDLIRDLTLDNFFLTTIASYGILCWVAFLNYFCYIVKFFKTKRHNRRTFNSAMLIFISWCMIGFSYDIEAYVQLIIMCYSVWGYLYCKQEMNIVLKGRSKMDKQFLAPR